MNKLYYETVDAMEKAGVDKEYMDGWMSGFLHHPRRGPQHTTKGYMVGYEDGFNQDTLAYKGHVHQAA